MSELPTFGNLSVGDVVTPLSEEALAHYPELYQTTAGKFVVVGATVLVAPHIEVGSQCSELMHADIYKWARFDSDDEALQSILRQEAVSPSVPPTRKAAKLGIADAGYVTVSVDEAAELTGIAIRGKSNGFDRADSQGRLRTGDLFRTAVGSNVQLQLVE